MKIPLSPPSLASVMKTLSQEEIVPIFDIRSPVLGEDYIHWDRLRHRVPPEGLTLPHWWAGIKIARMGLLRPLPLFDKTGKSFVFGTPEPVLIHLHHIDRDAGGQIKAPINLCLSDHQTPYLVNSLIEEAITSSQLEGASTTRKVAEAMLREGRKPTDHSETMIYNNYLAMERIREIKSELITPDRILELHRVLTDGTLEDPDGAGRLRKTDDVRVVDNRDGALLHQPPDHTELPQRLERLCAFANADDQSTPFVHPVIRAILLHFMIGYDHPFVDGNGRTARALFYWSMARAGYWLLEYVSISAVLRKAPAQYVRAYLYTETDEGDTTYFLLHQLGIIRQAIGNLHEYLARVAQEQKNTEQLFTASRSQRDRLNHRQIALITHALKHPGEQYFVEAHQRTHGVVYQTARTDLLKLVSLGLLNQGRSGRAFHFIAPDDLKERIAVFNAQSET